jgi:hypothetical protein
VASFSLSPTAAWSASRRWRISSGLNLYSELACGVPTTWVTPSAMAISAI